MLDTKLTSSLDQLDDLTFEAYLAYRDQFDLVTHTDQTLKEFQTNYLGLYPSMEDFVAGHLFLPSRLRTIRLTRHLGHKEALRALVEELSGQVEFVQYHDQAFAFICPDADPQTRKEFGQ